jgi:hypothetical protein
VVTQVMASSGDSPSPGSSVFAFILLVLFFWGVVAGVRALGNSAWKQRRAQISAYAAQRGWAYQPGVSRGWASAFTAAPFNAGFDRKARDVLSGVTGTLPFVSFEYLYIDKNIGGDPGGRREVARTYFFSVVAIQLGWVVPRTEFLPEGAGSKIAEFFGGKDLSVESNAFNQMWRVRAVDERAAHSLLTPRMIERMLEPDFAGRALFLENGFIVHYVQEPRSEFWVDAMLAHCQAFLDLVPAFVQEDYGRRV